MKNPETKRYFHVMIPIRWQATLAGLPKNFEVKMDTCRFHLAASQLHWGKRKQQGICEIEAYLLHKKQVSDPFVEHVLESAWKRHFRN
jgi:hypothetical protein